MAGWRSLLARTGLAGSGSRPTKSAWSPTDMALRLATLSAEQELLLPTVREEWLGHGLSTAPADRAEAAEGVADAYRAAGLEPPRIIVWLSSPLAGCIGMVFLDELLYRLSGQVWDQVRGQVWGQVWDQVWGQVGDQVWGQVGGQVRGQVRGRVGGQVWGQVRGQVWGQVGGQVRDQVWDQVGD